MFTIKTPAKINWFLQILFSRPDGFHEIRSMIQKVTLYDELLFIPAQETSIITDTDIALNDNLIYKAARLLQEKYSVSQGAEIHLTKQIPIAAGLGGGSSDAATALVGLNRLWSLGLPLKDLHLLAQSLGSDIPFFLYSSLAYVEGRGEIITPCTAKNPLPLVLVKPPLSISTAWAYKNSTVSDTGQKHSPETFCHLIEKRDFHNLRLFNDLEKPVISTFPIIGEIKERLYKQGAVLSLMSGSGSTVFGVFSSSAQAQQAAGYFHDCWTSVVETLI